MSNDQHTPKSHQNPATRILIFTHTIALPSHCRCFCAHLLGSWKSLALNLCIWMVMVFPSPKNIHLNDDGCSVNKKAGEGGTVQEVRCVLGHFCPACPSVEFRSSCHIDLYELLCNTRIIILALFPFYIDFCAKCHNFLCIIGRDSLSSVLDPIVKVRYTLYNVHTYMIISWLILQLILFL